MKVPPAIEAKYVNSSDDELVDLLGEYHEQLRRLKEARRDDPEVVELKGRIKEIENTRYNANIKRTEVHLEAVRALAKLRGLRFE